MAPGIILIIIGATFALAIRAESSWVDVRVLGLILMLGGAAFVWRSQVRRREVITREVDHPATGHEETTVLERRVE